MFSNMFIHREQFAESFAYDEDNNLISTTNLSAEKSDMKYDAFDNLTSYVQPGADSADKYLFTYGSTDEEKKRHLVMSETTPMGLKQYYAYDAYGNRTATRAQKSSSEPRIRSCTWYDSTDNYPVRTMDARGNEVRKEVDATSGLVYNVTDPAGLLKEGRYGFEDETLSSGPKETYSIRFYTCWKCYIRLA